MKIQMLTENTSCREDLKAEHGLSMLIETGGKKILFDTGQTGLFAENADKLGARLEDVDFCVLSHGHYDHGGGLPAFFSRNESAPVYCSSRAFGDFYNGQKYIGLDPELRGNPRFRSVSETTELLPGVTLIPGTKEPVYPVEAYGLSKEENGQRIPDDFIHEQYLLIEENGMRILFSGCSHRGILNIMNWFSPDILIGGFHFKKLNPEGEGRQKLQSAAEILRGYPTRYYTCHCTGTAQYMCMKEILGDRLSYLSAGDCLTF